MKSCPKNSELDRLLDKMILDVGKRQASAILDLGGQIATAVNRDKAVEIKRYVACQKRKIRRIKKL